jgi:hypothetical protein
MKRVPNTLGAIPRLLARIAPFFLPALFFQSALFAVISPVPLFILTLKNPLSVSLLALGSNLMIFSYFGATPNELIALGTFWFGVGALFPFFIRKSGRIHLSLVLSFAYLVLMLVGMLYYRAHGVGMSGTEYLRSEISIGMDHLINLPNSPVKKLIEEQGREGLFRQLMTELPSGILIGLLLSLWLNLLFASQIVPGFLSRTFWSKFRNPEWLVWPTLISAALYAFTEHAPYYLGLNVFKVLLVLYGLQGLSIMGFLLNRYKIFGLGRVLVLAVAILLAMPLVLSLGFFDLWFDFRRKLGQI